MTSADISSSTASIPTSPPPLEVTAGSREEGRNETAVAVGMAATILVLLAVLIVLIAAIPCVRPRRKRGGESTIVSDTPIELCVNDAYGTIRKKRSSPGKQDERLTAPHSTHIQNELTPIELCVNDAYVTVRKKCSSPGKQAVWRSESHGTHTQGECGRREAGQGYPVSCQPQQPLYEVVGAMAYNESAAVDQEPLYEDILVHEDVGPMYENLGQHHKLIATTSRM